jgi:arylsulfatase A-like enzyme
VGTTACFPIPLGIMSNVASASRMSRALIAGLLSVTVLLAAGCGQDSPQDTTQSNVIVVLVDTLRADVLDSYGAAYGATPHMDALATEGFRFDQAIATSSWTLPSIASLFTGTWPTIHGGLGKNMLLSPIRDELPTAAEVLQQAGFETSAYTNAAFLNPALHLDRGFDRYDHMDARNDELRRADEIIDHVLTLMTERQDQANFVFVHLFDPHLDYDPPAGYRTRFTGGLASPAPPLGFPALEAAESVEGGRPRATIVNYIKGVYMGEVNFVDDQIGRLIDGLKQLGLYDATTLIVTSDHGEEFWDHGEVEHGHTLYDELIRIPLIIKPPQALSLAGKTIEHQVRILDIMPTVFDIGGIGQPESFLGVSLLPLMRGETMAALPAFSEGTLYGQDRLSWRKDGYKLIYEMDAVENNAIELTTSPLTHLRCTTSFIHKPISPNACTRNYSVSWKRCWRRPRECPNSNRSPSRLIISKS